MSNGKTALITACNVLCCVMLCYVVLCYVVLCYVMLCCTNLPLKIMSFCNLSKTGERERERERIRQWTARYKYY